MKHRYARAILIAAVLMSPMSGGATQTRVDGKDPEALVRRMYDVLSGSAGARDWESFASLFHEKAVMGFSVVDAQGNLVYRSFTPAEYVKRNDQFFRTQDFYVEEIHRITERFGEIMHVFSTYRFRAELNGQVQQSGKGINSIQLVRDANRWWIMSIQYTNERPDLSVPKEYLGPLKQRM